MKHKINGTKENIERAIDNITGYKAYRNREILKAHYIDGMTFEDVAEMFDMSVRHIKKITYDNENIIIENMRVES